MNRGARPVPIAVLISGTGDNMAAIIAASRADDSPFDVALVLSNRADAGGLERARAAGVPTLAVPHKGLAREAHDAAVHEALMAAGVGFVALAGYMRILTPALVRQWAGRMVNIHPSLLPRHRGLDTHARAIAAGDRDHGASVHWVTEGLDEGPVIAQARVPVMPDDTPAALAARVKAAELALYPGTLRDMLAGPGAWDRGAPTKPLPPGIARPPAP